MKRSAWPLWPLWHQPLGALALCFGIAIGLSGRSGNILRAATDDPLTFNRDVAPIVYENCTPCHRPGGSAPFSLVTYADVRQRSALIAAVTENQYMPPWQPDGEFGEIEGDRRLPHYKIDIFQRWVEQGSIEGDPKDLPEPPHFPSEWRLGRPDVIVKMAEPFDVPADGPDVFRNFVLRVPGNERRYVQALEFRPGDAKVVHHVRILIDETNEVRRLDAADPGPGFGGMDVPGARFPEGHFLGWTPGKLASKETYPWAFQPGTDIVLQMHLKPNGRRETLQASVGLYFTDDPPDRSPLLLRLGTKTMDIPPGESDYEVTDSYSLPVDVNALSIYPHAHYLAKEMSVVATKPDGATETLLHIPSWDFNWQDEYDYAHPIPLPKGTRIDMLYTYDNSAANPHNPSAPPARVRFGQETTDEMGELLLQVMPRDDQDAATLRAEMTHKALVTDVAGEEKIIKDNPANYEARNALAVGYVQLNRLPDAIREFAEVLRVAPDHAKANYNMGLLSMKAGLFDEAYDYFKKALKSQPDYGEAHNNMGVIVESEGLPDEAIDHYLKAIEIKPSNAAAQGNLGRILLRQGKLKDAIGHFKEAVRARPDDPDAQYNLARALSADGQARDALSHLRRGLERRPDSVPILTEMTWILSSDTPSRNGKEALERGEKANQLSGGENPMVLDALAAAYAANDQFAQAIKTAEMALQGAKASKATQLAVAIRERIEQYQQAGTAGPSRFR